MISLYVHPTCTSCRKAVALLDDAGADIERRDYFKDRFTADELTAVLARAGRTPIEMLSTRAKAYRDLGIANRTLTEEELIALMVEEPTLLRRPLAVTGGQSTVGFNVTDLNDLAASDSGQ